MLEYLEYVVKHTEIIYVIAADRNVGLIANYYRCRKAVLDQFTAISEEKDYWTDPKKLQKQIYQLLNPDCDFSF